MFYIGSDESKYLEGVLLANPSPTATENALERLCALYRKGGRLKETQPFKAALIALLSLSTQHKKVVRWVLNAITEVFHKRGDDFTGAIYQTIERYSGDAEIVCAAVTALFSIGKEEKAVFKMLKKLHIPLDGAILVAASPHSEKCRTELARVRIKIDSAIPIVLQHASVLIGTNKAPEHFFEPRHTNKAVIGALNGHNNPLVVQYSVWAMAENPQMGIEDLRLNIADTPARPENVRRWLYQLITKTDEVAKKHRDLIQEASTDQHDSVREGLASGLRNIYFDGLEEIIIDWFGHEANAEVKALLNDHMTSNSDKCPDYKTCMIETYQGLASNAPARLRLRLAAAGTDLHRQMVKLDLNEQADLFGLIVTQRTHGESTVTNNQTNNIYGQVGGISMTGAINLEHAVLNNTGDEKLKEILLKLVAEVKSSTLTDAQRQEVQGLIATAAKSPSQSTFDSLIHFAERVHLALWLKASLFSFLIGLKSSGLGG